MRVIGAKFRAKVLLHILFSSLQAAIGTGRLVGAAVDARSKSLRAAAGMVFNGHRHDGTRRTVRHRGQRSACHTATPVMRQVHPMTISFQRRHQGVST